MRGTLLLTCLFGLAACTMGPDPPRGTPTVTPDTGAATPTALIYVDRTSLGSYDLSMGTSEVITELPSADVAVSPDGHLYAVVEETDPRGPGPEGFRAPQIIVSPTDESEPPRTMGPGRAPEWAPTSDALAVIAPTPAGETIAVYEPSGDKITTRAPSDELWAIVGWSRDKIVAIGSRSGVVAIPTDDGDIRAFRMQPARLWGVSPIERREVVVGERGAVITGNGGVRPIDVNAALGDGTWSFEGATIAVAFIEGPRTRLGLIDVASGQVREVADGARAQGNVVWALDGKTFAFVRVDDERRSRLEAVVCTSSTECTSAFSWDEGVRLLAFHS